MSQPPMHLSPRHSEKKKNHYQSQSLYMNSGGKHCKKHTITQPPPTLAKKKKLVEDLLLNFFFNDNSLVWQKCLAFVLKAINKYASLFYL